MRAAPVAVAIFALIAFDLAKNDGELYGRVIAFMNHAAHEMRIALNR